MPTNGTRNRNAGHSWELEGVKDFTPFFPGVATSRACNRMRDAEKVDLAYPDESKLGRFPYNLQYKNYSKSLHYPKVLAAMPQDSPAINVVMHKQTEKVGTRFMTRERYAILKYSDFLLHVAWRRAYEIITEYLDFVPDEEKKELEERLKNIGL